MSRDRKLQTFTVKLAATVTSDIDDEETEHVVEVQVVGYSRDAAARRVGEAVESIMEGGQ